jgi:hypothetical protein
MWERERVCVCVCVREGGRVFHTCIFGSHSLKQSIQRQFLVLLIDYMNCSKTISLLKNRCVSRSSGVYSVTALIYNYFSSR